jgi:Cu-Zn family superoxide dismutase
MTTTARRSPLLAGLAGLVAWACAGSTATPGLPGARAELADAAGKTVARATFAERDGGVALHVTGSGLPPGPHGFHVHANPSCEPPDFTSAGGHFNPGGRKHGMKNPDGPHAGDLPNLTVRDDGTVDTTITVRRELLEAGPSSILGGTSLLIHEKPDDMKTDPSGDSGKRIACGVITRQ